MSAAREPIFPNLLVLASGSPRRRALLEAAGLNVLCRPQDVDERWPGGEGEAAVIEVALQKLRACGEDTKVVLAADTVVLLGDRPLGKPVNRDEAVATLSDLSGREHCVSTGVAIRRGGKEHVFAVSTQVCFRSLCIEEINRYVDLGECFDKAGAYGIQGNGAFLIQSVMGSYTNVVGLPLAETLDALRSSW